MRLGGFLGTAGIYTVANALNASLPLLLMPLLTRYMAPADYGLMVMFQLLCTVVGSFVGVSIHGAVSRQYGMLDKPSLATYVANCLFILFASTAVLVVAFAMFSGFVERLSQFPANWYWAVLVAAFFQFLTLTLLSIWQMEGRPVAYGALQILQTAINIGLSAWLVAGLKLGWIGGVLAQVIAYASTGLAAAWLLRSLGWLRWRYVPAYVKDALRFGVPLIPHTIGATLIAMTDRVMIANMVGIAEAGIYTVGYQVALVIAMLQNSFNQAWVPWVYARLKGGRDDDKRLLVRATYLYFVVILLLVCALAVIAPFMLRHLVGSQFSSANSYVFWIALGYAFNGMYKMVSIYIFYHSKTHLLAAVTALTALLNVAFIYAAIRFNGAVGAAQATALAFLLSFALTWILAAQLEPLPWGLGRARR